MAARLTAYIVAFIVGTTLIAGLIVGAQREDGPVDLIVVNGNVYTADGAETMAEAVAVQGNKILMVGSNREVQRLRRPQTVVIDAKGGAVLPGFNDANVELVEAGLMLTEVNLDGASTVLSIESAIKAWAARHPDRDWITGSGWEYESFDGRLPSRHQLDAIVGDRPVFLTSQDRQAAWANTAALKLARITRRTPNPPGGVIVRDPRTGEPTGLLKDAAMALVAEVVPEPTHEERLAAVRAAIEDAHRRGVTSVQHEGDEADVTLFDDLRRARALGLRVYAVLAGSMDWTAQDYDRLDLLRAKYDDDPLFKAGAVRLSVDQDVDEEALTRTTAELDKRGWQIIFETVGEGARRLALNAIELATGDRPARDETARHRVEPRRDGQDELLDPVLGLHVALNTGIADALPTDSDAPEDRRMLVQAIDGYTREAARASFDEHRKGSLERDMLADIVVLSHDIFTLPASRVAEAEVAVTIFDGKVVYTRSAESD